MGEKLVRKGDQAINRIKSGRWELKLFSTVITLRLDRSRHGPARPVPQSVAWAAAQTHRAFRLAARPVRQGAVRHRDVRPAQDPLEEVRRGLPVQMDEAVEKLAVRELRLEDAVPAHLDSAWAVFPERLASVDLAERWARRRAAAEPCTPDEAQSAA